jgi:hypothetical protein
MTGKKGKGPAAEALQLQKETPAIPEEPKEHRVLETLLEEMGCAGLLSKPWAFQSEHIAAELGGVPPKRLSVIRAHLEKWTSTMWKETYGFRDGMVFTAEKKGAFFVGEFLHEADPKDRYAITDLKHRIARLVFSFLNPFFHPEIPKRIVGKLATVFLGAMRGKHQVDWAVLMKEEVERMRKNLQRGRKTPTPISTYVGHLYARKRTLSLDEQDEFDKLLKIQSYGVEKVEISESAEKEKREDMEDSANSSPLLKQLKRKRDESPSVEPELELLSPPRQDRMTQASTGSDSTPTIPPPPPSTTEFRPTSEYGITTPICLTGLLT